MAGEFDLEGDFVEAVRFYERQPRPASLEWLLRAAGRLDPILRIARSRSGAARDVRFHYDRSNEFYRLFLDQRVIYSCAYFRDPGYSLEKAQAFVNSDAFKNLAPQRDKGFKTIRSYAVEATE